LDYEFARSRDLYDGIDRFQRVFKPQPGDLIVWPGHVGIIVDPSEHTFYSSLRGGLMTDYYDAPHWLRRGKPRFYRYRSDGERELRATARVRALHDTDEIPQQKSKWPTQQASAPTSHSSLTADRGSRTSSASDDTSIQFWSKPSKDDLQWMLTKQMDAEAERLLLQDSLGPAKNITVVDQIEIENLKVKKDTGWAELRIEHRISVIDGQVLGRRVLRRRLVLRRNGRRWILENPQPTLHLPRAFATKFFAHYLSLLARNSSDNRAMRTAVKVLDALLEDAERVGAAEVSPR
jgi:hypothetical protein